MAYMNTASHDLTTTSWDPFGTGPNKTPTAPFGAFPVDKAKIVIIDDQSTNIEVLEEYLRQAGYKRIIGSTESTRARNLIEQSEPDLVLLDLNMPIVDGQAVLRWVRQNLHLATLPVLVLTASDDGESRRESLELGATDYLLKPIDPSELLLRVGNALSLRFKQRELANHAARLESQVRQRTEQLWRAQREAIHCLAKASEYRDHETGAHVLRVGRYAGLLARELCRDDDFVRSIELAATLHDVGKIAVPDSILQKAGKLDPDEYERMQRHCGLGDRMCRTLGPDETRVLRTHTEAGPDIIEAAESPLMKMAARIAKTHHEKWNGEGYPLGLKGEEIPLEGRIVAVADVFDALSSRRPYKPAFPIDKCLAILEEGSGEHFDPEVVRAFMAVKSEIVAVRIDYSDE